MSAQHTPGPWKRGHMGDCENAWIGPDYDQPLVAKVDRTDRDEWEANARLIAAAPELLSVVRDFMENPLFQVAVGGNPNMVDAFMERARAALAKATSDA